MNKMFKANIACQIISMYRRKRFDYRSLFDSIMNEHKANGRSPGKELVQRLKEKTGCQDEVALLQYLKNKATQDRGQWQNNLQETIWETLND